MRRHRKTYSKQTGLILACITLLVVFVVAVIAKRTSVFIGSTFYLIVIVPIIKSWKYDTDLGTMLVGGLLRGAIWTGLFIGMAILSRNNPLIEKIVLWPIK